MARRDMLALESASRRRRPKVDPSAPPQFFITPVGKTPAASGPRGLDLLHTEPRAWGDLTGAAELVRFAFEGGDCAGVFDTLIEARQVRSFFVGRPWRWHEQNQVEPTLIARLLGQDEMALMDGIECAAKDADTHDPTPS